MAIKNTKTLLLLTYHFPPSAAVGAHRMLGFARHLTKFGWEPIVAAPPQMLWEPVDPGLAERIPKGTVVRYVRFPTARPWRMLMALLDTYYEFWLPGAFLAANQLMATHRPAAVFTSGPPHCVHLLGSWMKRRWGVPWVADFRDPWITAALKTSPPSFRLSRERRWERRVMREADVIVHNAPAACRALQAAYPEYSEKMAMIPNGYDAEDFAGATRRRSPNGTVQILHTGSIYMRRDPGPVLDAVARASNGAAMDLAGIRFRFVGCLGGYDLSGEAERRGLAKSVEYGGLISHGQTISEMCRADILLLLDTPGRRAGVPAKIYEYIGADRPILCLGEPDGDLAWVLRQSGVPHRIVRPGDVAGITGALAELIGVVRRERNEPGRKSTPSPVYTRERMAQQLASVLDGRLREMDFASPLAAATTRA